MDIKNLDSLDIRFWYYDDIHTLHTHKIHFASLEEAINELLLLEKKLQ